MTRDRTVRFLREGYLFGARERDRQGRDDALELRLLGVPFLLLRGREGARAFYDATRVQRAGAVPLRVRGVLFGHGAVHGLDDADHRRRKAQFMAVLGPAAGEQLVPHAERAWARALPQWERRGSVRLFEASGEVLCRAVLDWAGVPARDEDVPARTAQLRGMVEGATGIGPRHWRGWASRLLADRWAAGLVERVRAGAVVPPAGSPLASVASWTGRDGRLLPSSVAGVELVNMVRPAVAVDRLVVFAAMALHEHPQWRRAVAEDDAELDRFVLEVRRRAPFVPLLAARTRTATTVAGVRVPAGRRVLLDVYGTDHDPRLWPEPRRFDPDRFRGRDIGPFELVPQGGGDHTTGHRCPGEWATEALLRTAVRALARDVEYDVPPQDLRVPANRLLGLPRSRFRIERVRRRTGAVRTVTPPPPPEEIRLPDVSPPQEVRLRDDRAVPGRRG